MKKQLRKTGKILAVLLTLAMLLSMAAVSTNVSAKELTTLLELDFSNIEAETFVALEPTEEALINKSSGITTGGTWAADTVLGFAQRSDNQTTIKKGSFENAEDGTTYYLDYNDATVYPNTSQGASYGKHLTDVQFFNNKLESADNTISFWVNETASCYFKELFCYRVDYTKSDGESKSIRSFDLGVNPDGTWNALTFTWVDKDHADAKTDGAFSVPLGWKHVVITNPVSADNSKTMSVYVNGEFKKNVTLDIPSDATVDHVTASFFSKSDGTNLANEYWRSNYWIAPAGKLADVKVYDGILEEQDVADLYSEQLPSHIDVNNKIIEGYSFTGETVEYDGTVHNIAVTAEEGATEDVTVEYTCNDAAFMGAVEIGTYSVTATITKDGYLPLTLTATLKIKKPSVQPQDGDILVDLDFSTYVKDDTQVDPRTVEGSVGEVTNNGVLSESTVLKFKSSAMVNNWCNYSLALESFENTLGEMTNYLHKTVGVDYCGDSNRFSAIYENELEDTANTITFWLKYVPQTRSGVQWNILDYYAVYDGAGKHLFAIEQAGASAGKCTLTGRGESHWSTSIAKFDGEWVHVAVKNPEYALDEESGQMKKTMKVYINGELKGEQVITKPEGALEEVKLGLLGEVTSTTGKFWPQDASIGGFKVYYGALTGEEIAAKYNEELPNFSEPTDPLAIKFVNDQDEEIESFEGLSAVTFKYTPGPKRVVLSFVACYDENGKMLSVKCMEENKEASLEVEIPEGTKTIKAFVWENKTSLHPLTTTLVLEG